MRISDWSSDVCSSDLRLALGQHGAKSGPSKRRFTGANYLVRGTSLRKPTSTRLKSRISVATDVAKLAGVSQSAVSRAFTDGASIAESTRKKVLETEEHKSELQSLMRISSAVFCLKNKKNKNNKY